ncbi:SCO family protein [Desertivirga arenae]|uniref:SCO family protein n=1 Tax=Desertivirga arenae TaxID=2810309 RepID=UPI001A9634A6|nr:SCO family protein [Pedobacter sp. SYSU D00823]
MANNRSSIKKILILVSILAVPGFLYFLLQEKGKNRYRPLSFFGPKHVASTFHTRRGVKIPDTVYHTISDFKLIDQQGDSIGLPADTAQITVVNFFFSRCQTVCPVVNLQLKRVVDEYRNNPLIKFYSISVDPEYDNPSVLAKYALNQGASVGKWMFLTGDKAMIHQLARKDFLVDVLDTGKPVNINHSSMLILVDPKKRIRGYYDGTNKEQVDKLLDEIKVQIAEELRKVAYQ